MKRITMTCRDERGVVTIEDTFDVDTDWRAIAYVFKNFLQAQGFNPAEGAVGESVESYVAYGPDSEDEGRLW